VSLFFPDKSFFGLDIGSKMIKIVQLAPGKPKPKLVVCNGTKIDEKFLRSENKNDIRELASILKQLAKQSKVTTQNVVCSVSAADVFSTVISLPPMPKTEIGKAVGHQAKQLVPDGGKDMNIDWHILERKDTGIEVRLVAAPQRLINKYVNVLELAGFNPIVIELGAIAAARSLILPTMQDFMLVDVGYTKVEIVLVNKGFVKFIHTMESGGKYFERALEKELSIDNAQAVQFKQKFGLKEDKLEGHILKVLKPYVDDITVQINRVIQSFSVQKKQGSIDHIFICGGDATIPGFTVYLSSEIGIETHIATPWSKIDYPKDLQAKLDTVAPLYIVAAGLAMRGYND